MSENRTDYGTKKMIYSRKRQETATRDYGDFEPDVKWDEHGKYRMPLFVLCGPYSDVAEKNKLSIESCYCPECRKQFAFGSPVPDLPLDRFDTAMSVESLAVNISRDKTDPVFDAEPVCPECGLSGDMLVFLPKQEKNENREDHIDYNGSWRIPPVFQGRYLFEYRDSDGNITRMDDNTMLEHTVIFPSGKQFTWQTEFSQTLDLKGNRIMSRKTRIDGNGRTPVGAVTEAVNPFAYINPKQSFSMESRINVQDLKNVMCSNVTRIQNVPFISFKDKVMGDAFSGTAGYPSVKKEKSRTMNAKHMLYGGISADALMLLYEDTAAAKSRAAMEHAGKDLPHPVYQDTAANGLNLSRHTKGATEENTPVNRELRDLHTYMSVRYPAAVELAAQKAELRAANYEFSEKRKAQETPGYEAKKATDPARAKFFREEMRTTAEQLAACDDKVLNEIRLAGSGSPVYVLKDGKIQKTRTYTSPEAEDGRTGAMQEMKDRLSFFVFGLREGYPVPGDIALKLKDARTMNAAVQPTKKLKNSFAADPIAMASNLYTLRKWGITNSDHVKQTLDLAACQSPEVNPGPVRTKNRRVQPARGYKNFINAGVLAPMRDRTALSFIKLYMKTHDTSAVISQIFDNREDAFDGKWNQFVEDVKLYHDVMDNPAVSIIRTKDDMKQEQDTGNSGDIHENRKAQLRNYLDNSGKDGIRSAYRDFAGIYGANTVEMVNTLAREIKDDRQMDEIKRLSLKEGMDAALSRYGDFLSRYDDPAKAVEEHEMFSDRTLVITTRNNKPLFERDLKEIHDELSEIAKKSVRENEYLDLAQPVLAMNESVSVDLSELPASQWNEHPEEVPAGTMGEFSFHVLDNRFDFVRTATNLRNCVAAGTYFNDVKRGRNIIVSMDNENGQTCACIELVKNSSPDAALPYYVNQFQGYRDGVVDARYGKVFTDWCSRHGIDCDRDPSGNVSACLNGERRYFYGHGNADYHTEEYDPVLNTSISNSKAERLRQERIEKAIELYGGSPESGPCLPEVPDDLRY